MDPSNSGLMVWGSRICTFSSCASTDEHSNRLLVLFQGLKARPKGVPPPLSTSRLRSLHRLVLPLLSNMLHTRWVDRPAARG